MNSAEKIYLVAYDTHYSKKNYTQAYAIYEEIVENYPNSEYAKYSFSQMENIKNIYNFSIDSISPTEHEQAKLIANGENIEINPTSRLQNSSRTSTSNTEINFLESNMHINNFHSELLDKVEQLRHDIHFIYVLMLITLIVSIIYGIVVLLSRFD